MKVACIDKSASQRLELQRLVVDAFDCSREAIGHLSVLDFLPATKEELLIGGLNLKSSNSDNQWSGAIIGPGYPMEELFEAASEVRSISVNLPIFCFITPENYSIRILRRLERISVEVFRTDDSAVRIVHGVLKSLSRPTEQPSGKLVVLEGAKGGQGTSSIAVGMAHAAAAEGKSALVIDLSKEGSLFHYLQSDKWQSSDYRTLLVDRLNPTKAILDRLIVEAPNGVNLLLPPAGGAEIRELWIRSPQSFEITLGLIELLKERFDLVLVDLARAEGLLPFSLLARADIRMVVASNEPAAVHLLNDKLIELRELPISSRTIVLLNLLLEHSLTLPDIEDFLLAYESQSSTEILSIPFDASGTNWVGTGNSIYTEGSTRLQTILRGLVRAVCSGTVVQSSCESDYSRSSFGLFSRLGWRKKMKSIAQPLLPAPEQSLSAENINFILTDELKDSFKSVSKIRPDKAVSKVDFLEGYQSPKISKVRAAGG